MRHGHMAVFAALFYLLTPLSVPASLVAAEQYATGIAGRVTTSDGSIVVGAEIQVSQGKTKLAIKAVTDSKGEYWLELKPGTYDISVDWPSWKPAKRKNINVEKNVKSTIDFVLQPGKPIVTDQNHP